MKILLAVTFVYGVLYLLTMTKLFNTRISTFFEGLFGWNKKIFKALDIWFVYFSLVFQVWYWLFNK